MSSTIPDLPRFVLRGGPYDGLVTRREGPIEGVLYFPESVIVKGEHGSATYALTEREGERVGEYQER